MVKRLRHMPEQIIRQLAEGQKLLARGASVEEVCRTFEITESTWACWMNEYGGMKAYDAKRLKKLLAEAELDKDMLRGVTGGRFLPQTGGGQQ